MMQKINNIKMNILKRLLLHKYQQLLDLIDFEIPAVVIVLDCTAAVKQRKSILKVTVHFFYRGFKFSSLTYN